MHYKKLKRAFYNRDTKTVAQDLLGKYLIYKRNGQYYIGKIVEVEAYLGSFDLACHGAKGLTKRNQVMFGPAGFAYVYMIYGMYYCLNIVTEKSGHPSAVLIRALEPIHAITDNTKGPGLLCKALKINTKLNGHDLLSDDFFIAADDAKPTAIVKRPRIGVAYAKHWAKRLLRFYLKDNPYVSKK